MGNSSGVIIQKPILAQIGVEAGDDLDLSLDDGRIVLVPREAASGRGVLLQPGPKTSVIEQGRTNLSPAQAVGDIVAIPLVAGLHHH